MGGGNAKLNKNDLRELKSLTHFKKHEISQWYKDFMSECPEGILKKEEFFQIYSNFFPHGDSTKFASFIFDIFDFNRAGYVTFREFIIALSITSRGTMDEKLDWAFRLYDIDGDGYISKQEMTTVVEAIFKMVGGSVELPVDENTPEKRVEKIFKQMDLNRDGFLSIEEFRDGSKSDPWIVQAMSLHLPEIN